MSSNFETFKELHLSKNLFVLPNVWNVKSALIFQKQNFPAIATSSAAVANSLGYEDGEGMPFEEYLVVIKRIISSVEIPVTIDMEMGYGTTDEEILSNILSLIDLGVVGINIEDSVITKQGRMLKETKSFAKTVGYIKNRLVAKNLNLFINVRCDTYILNVENKQQETGNRLRIYNATGADGIFLPCISNEEDIAEAISNTNLPLNVMCIPGLPGFDVLNKLGVKRISMGPFLFNKIYDQAAQLSNVITEGKNFSPLFS